MLNGELIGGGVLTGEIGRDVITISKEEQEVVIEPRREQFDVYPDVGKVIKKATVKAVTSDIDENITARNIRGGVTILGVTGDLEPDKPDQSKVVEPSTSEQVITADSGYELASVTIKPVTAEIDSDIVAENIRKDTEILGVMGTMEAREDLDTELAEQETLLAELESGVNELPDKPVDRLQWKCDNMQTLNNEFQDYKGTDLGEALKGLDISKVKTMNKTFSGCTYMTNFPALNTGNVEDMQYIHSSNSRLENTPNYDYSSVKNINYGFQYCSKLLTANLNLPSCTTANALFTSCSVIEEVNLNLPLATSISAICQYCYKLKTIIINCKPKNCNSAFAYSSQIETIKGLDLINATNVSNILSSATSLMNVEIKNIKITISIYSSKLTDESLVFIFNELHDLTGQTAQTLTLSTPSEARTEAIYVKLIEVTDEMRAEDEYIDNKKPCVVCESTDEGAMTLKEYGISKNWQIAG